MRSHQVMALLILVIHIEKNTILFYHKNFTPEPQYIV